MGTTDLPEMYAKAERRRAYISDKLWVPTLHGKADSINANASIYHWILLICMPDKRLTYRGSWYIEATNIFWQNPNRAYTYLNTILENNRNQIRNLKNIFGSDLG